jgi:hypothetical protein
MSSKIPDRKLDQLKKMGLMKPAPVPARTLSTSTASSKAKDFASLSSPDELIPKGPDVLKKTNGFGDFRDPTEFLKSDSNGKRTNGLVNEDLLESLNGDDLNRDARDNEREQMKTEEEVRMEEDLAGEVSKMRLKRSHSTTSLQEKAANPETPPASADQPQSNIFSTPGGPSNGLAAKKTEPETPAKKRRGSNDLDVKSPQAGPVRGLGFGGDLGNIPPAFGGPLGQPSSSAMEEEEL